MKTSLLLFCSFFVFSGLCGQKLAGEYFVGGQDGEIVLRLQYAAGNQLQGILTDMQGNSYQVQATEEDGEAFGTLTNQQGGLYFEAMREGADLHLTLIPAGTDGQPDPSGGQEFIMKARSRDHGGPAGLASGGAGGPIGNSAAPAATGWNDTFSGTIEGTATILDVKVNAGRLSGDIDAGGYRYTLNGTVSGNQSQGKLLDPQTQGTMNYSATLNGDQLAFTIQNPMNGQSQSLQFSRGRAAAAAAPGNAQSNQMGGHNFERDNRLVGGWNYTDSYTSGDFGFAAQWKLIINPDGTFLYGDGRVIGGGPGVSGDSGGGGDITRGQWRTENKIIYINEGNGWQPYCRYSTNGQSLLMEFGDGSKQLWKRTH